MKKYYILLILTLSVFIIVAYSMFEVDYIPKHANNIVCLSGHTLDLIEDKRGSCNSSFKRTRRY